MTRPVPSSARRAEFGSLPAAQLLRVVVYYAASLLVLTACWVLIRRFRGSLQEPLALTSHLVLGGVLSASLASCGLFARRIVSRNGAAETPGLLVPRALLTVAALLAGVAVSVPGTPVVALLVFWTLVALGTLPAWVPLERLRRSRKDHRPGVGQVGQSYPAVETIPIAPDRGISGEERDLSELDEEPESEEGLLPEGVSQRILRVRDERGTEIVYGTIRCDFAAGQRQQSVHIAFCPPLESIQDFTADQVSGPDAQIKPTMVETFGAGLELKLASPSKGPAEVQIQFFAFEKSTGDGDL